MSKAKNQPHSLSELADAAFDATAAQVVRRARETGTDIVVWRDNQIVHLSPDEFELEKNGNGKQDRNQQ